MAVIISSDPSLRKSKRLQGAIGRLLGALTIGGGSEEGLGKVSEELRWAKCTTSGAKYMKTPQRAGCYFYF